MILQDKINAGDIIVLDGATGTEIAHLGGEMNSAAWCAVANKAHPNTVRMVHEEYIRADADVITANTFATCRHVLDGAGLGDETVAINKRAVEPAHCQARANVAPGRPVAVAGSMSNTVARVPRMVSGDPKFLPAPEKEAANYREMADALAEGGADLILLEMMLDIERASMCLKAAVATGLPVWVGISCTQLDDGTMIGWGIAREERGNLAEEGYESGEAILLSDIIINALKAIGGDVFGIMHSSVTATTPGLETLFPALRPARDGLRRDAQSQSRHAHAHGDHAVRGLRSGLPWPNLRPAPCRHRAGRGRAPWVRMM